MESVRFFDCECRLGLAVQCASGNADHSVFGLQGELEPDITGAIQKNVFIRVILRWRRFLCTNNLEHQGHSDVNFVRAVFINIHFTIIAFLKRDIDLIVRSGQSGSQAFQSL